MSRLVLVVSVFMLSACYTTRVVSPVRPATKTLESRQWFTFGGLAPLSDPAGKQCKHGLAFVDSKMGAGDWAIAAGLTLLGELIGWQACSGVEDSFGRTACSMFVSPILPFLLSSRTTSYACASKPIAPRKKPVVSVPENPDGMGDVSRE